MSRLCPIKPLLRQLGDNAYRASPALISGEPRELRYIALASIERSYSGPMKAGDFAPIPTRACIPSGIPVMTPDQRSEEQARVRFCRDAGSSGRQRHSLD